MWVNRRIPLLSLTEAKVPKVIILETFREIREIFSPAEVLDTRVFLSTDKSALQIQVSLPGTSSPWEPYKP